MNIKQGFIASIMLLAITGAFESIAQIKTTELVFNTKTIEFQTRSFGKTLIPLKYTFTNNSLNDFIITKVVPGCGCTDVKYPRKVIKSGEKAEVFANFDPSHISGEVDKKIYIYGNFSDNAFIELHFKGTILAPETEEQSNKFYPGQYGYLRLLNYALVFGEILDTKEYEASLQIVNDYDKPLSVKEFLEMPNYLTYNLENKRIDPGDTVTIKFIINGAKIVKFGEQFEDITFNTNDIFFKTKSFRISFNLRKDFGKQSFWTKRKSPKAHLSEKDINLGTVRSGAIVKHTITLTNKGKKDLIIYRVKAQCRCAVLSQEISKVSKGESVKLQIAFDSIYANGKDYKTITLYTNDPQNPEINILVRAKVVSSNYSN